MIEDIEGHPGLAFADEERRSDLIPDIQRFTRRLSRPYLGLAENYDDWKYVYALWEDFPANQFVVLAESDQIVAVANSIPFFWDEDVDALKLNGFSWVIRKGFEDRKLGVSPNAASMLLIGIDHEYRSKHLSRFVLKHMKDSLWASGVDNVLGPLRPSLKGQYPLIPMDDYVTWTNPNGEPFDPWLRTHTRQGAQIVAVCNASSQMRDCVEAWETRTGIQMPTTGQYLVPDMLSPLSIDRERDLGVYTEANVWIRYEKWNAR